MKKTEFLTTTLIAHRGYHDIKNGIPENSIPAFERAIENKYIIELDVHILKDNKIVVFHDDNLKRMTEIDKEIKLTTYDEIKDLKLANTKYNIPLLTEVLSLVNNKVPIIIELKTDNKVGKLENELIKILNQYKGEFAVKSFSPLSVYWFKKHYPEIVRGQLASSFSNKNMSIEEKILLKNMVFNIFTKPDFISYDINALPNKRVEKIRKKHIVLGWTIKNNEQFEKGKKYCDNLICENFENLKI